MLGRWGRGVVAGRRWIAVAAVLVAVVGAAWGGGVFNRLVGGGFEDPGSESARAAAQLARSLGSQNPDVLALYSSRTSTVDDPSFRQAVETVAGGLRAAPGVASVASYYDGVPRLASTDRHSTYLVIRLRALADSDKRAGYDAIAPRLAAPGLTLRVGGTVVTDERVDAQTKTDVTRGEMVAFPLVLILLLLVFGGVVAAVMPLLIGVLAVLGALAVTRAITLATDVSTFAVNTITLLGLGMAIDYSLLIITRFREELRAGRPTGTAVAATVATAGRTVLVSGTLVILSMASMLIFPEVFLRSMALGGMAAVLVAMVSALTVLPALLAMLGSRIDALRVPVPRRRRAGEAAAGTPAGAGAWARLARSVMRRPVRYLGGVLVILAVLAVPLSHISFGTVDERVLPAGDPARTVAQRIATQFDGSTTAPVQVLLTGATAADAATARQEIEALPDVTSAAIADQRGTTVLITAGYAGGFAGTHALDAVHEIRALRPPAGTTMLVGGDPAVVRDEMSSLGDLLPWMLAIMAGVTAGILLLAFRSVLVPLKAVATNAVSVAATFGVLVWGFQDGHLAGPLGFTSTGTLEPTVLVLVLAVLFGLATDYEVFLLSRVRERWDATGDNTAAVSTGLQRTGRIITAAAALLIVVSAGFATGQIVLTKLIGVGMIVGILLDATLIRALLVPATMRLLGRWNWWVPAFLGRRASRTGVSATPAERPGTPALAD